MNQAQPLLAQLKDIHLPAPPSIWPLAWGWWLLSALAFMAISLISYTLLKRRKNRRALRAAKNELRNLKQRYSQAPYQEIHSDISRLIRRTVIAYHPEAASLIGDDWALFLSKISSNISQKQAQAMLHGAYQKNSDTSTLFSLTEAWLSALKIKKVT
jgi:hypothetical protein